jgi:phage replication-related protein YjqB (UPF0714/DUF867 family)
VTTFAELLRAPGVEERAAHRSPVGFLALHGGLEESTAEIARTAADRADASWYTVVQPDALRAHVPSHRMDPAISPVLTAFLAHCDVVVSLHGFGQAHLWTTLLVGGRARRLATALATTLRAALPGYTILDDLDRIPVGLRGLDPRNPVNGTRGGGVQLELPPRVRGIGPYWQDAGDDGLRPHTDALVHALACFAVDQG